MIETATGHIGHGIAPQARWREQQDGLATSHPRPPAAVGGDMLDHPPFAYAPPPPAPDVWQPVPEWATWLMLAIGISIVGLLLGAIVYLMG